MHRQYNDYGMKWGLFQSPSVKIHIARGLLGFGFLALTLSYAPVLGWWALLPGAAALVSFGGCPTCWLVGLAGTILSRLDGEPTSLCLDGSCKKFK
jgi:hypothetical protein